jgi:hypothetical protein
VQRAIRSVRVAGERLVALEWADGAVSVVDFGTTITQGGVFAPLADWTFFEQARLDDRGRVVSWPGDLEFCADALHEMGHVVATR